MMGVVVVVVVVVGDQVVEIVIGWLFLSWSVSCLVCLACWVASLAN